MEPLTPRQQEVLALIKAEIRETGIFPSLRSLAKQLKIKSPKGVADHLKVLERKGYLQPVPPQQSVYRLADEQDLEVQGFPLVSGLAAGVPKPAFDTPDRIVFNTQFFGGGELLAATVSGDSMIGDGIFDGDLVIIKKDVGLPGGQDIVAVRVEEEDITLKRMSKQSKGMVSLIASNPHYPARQVPANQVAILGRLVGVVRRV